MRRPPSLTLRLTLLFGLTAVLVLLAFGWFIRASIEDHFATEDLRELQIIAEAAQRVLTATGTADELSHPAQRFDDILVGHHNAFLYLAGRDARPVFASSGPDFASILRLAGEETGDDITRRWRDPDHTYRVLIRTLDERSVPGGPYTLAVVVPIDYHLRFLEEIRQHLMAHDGSRYRRDESDGLDRGTSRTRTAA